MEETDGLRLFVGEILSVVAPAASGSIGVEHFFEDFGGMGKIFLCNGE